MKRIVVWKVNGLGDFVTFLPTLSRIIDRHGIENILFVLSPISLEVLKIFYTPVHFQVISRSDLVDLYKHPIRFVRFFLKLRKFRASRSYFTFDECSSAYMAAFMAGIPERIGYNTKIAFGQKFLTTKLAFAETSNIYDIHALLLQDEMDDRAVKHPWNKIPSLEPIPDHSSSDESVIVIHPFAQFQYREWSFENYAALAKRIEEELNIRTVMIGEEQHRQRFISYPYKYQLNNTIGSLFWLIYKARFYIGNNSGPLHIAILANRPFVSIEGPSAVNWGPNNPDLRHMRLRNFGVKCAPCETMFEVPRKCINSEMPNACLKSITVQEVFHEVKKLLETN